MTARPEPRIRRVLMTGDTVGGVWTFALDLAEALGANDIEVVLATFGGSPSATQIAEASAIRNLCLLGSDLKLEWMDDPWDDVEESGRWLMKLESEYSPDVVHLNTFGHGALPWRAPTVLTAHSCVSSWWAAVRGDAVPASWNRYRGEVARSLRSVDLIAAPSGAMAGTLAGHHGVDISACRVIYNGRNAARFHRVTKEPLILAAGRVWDEAKNIAAVARAASGLAWPVYVAGDPQGLHLEGCHLLGRLPARELAEWHARAAIYALPARYEPFGLSILEAALSGCALVLGDIASLREIWGDAAFFVSPDEPGALRKALEILINDSGLRETMSQRAYARALTFSAAKMSQGYLDAYRSVVRARSNQCVS